MTRKQQGRKQNGKRKKSGKAAATTIAAPQGAGHQNFVSEAGRGCFIARRDQPAEWMIEWEDVDPSDFDDVEADFPDIAVDIDERTLSICNVDGYPKIAYVTVYETRVTGAHGEELVPGTTTSNTGVCQSCVTFIVLCPPRVFAHLCYLDVPHDQDVTTLRIESDVSKWNRHPDPSDEHPLRVGFPLSGGPFLCTQGEGGELTHFFSGNLHAIDFRCPIGTELRAVANGLVVDVKDRSTLTGIAVTNLFDWNGIMIKVEEEEHIVGDIGEGMKGGGGPLFVEYVHIATSLVQPGDRVKRGQVIGRSGSIGFSPEPHLHFSAFRSSDPEAPTVRVLFQGEGKGGFYNELQEEHTSYGNNAPTFLPRAGR